MVTALNEQLFQAKLHQGLPLSISLQVMTSVQRESFVAKTPSVKTWILKQNVNAGVAMPPSTGTPHTVKVGHLSVRCLELYGWQHVSCCSAFDTMWYRLLWRLRFVISLLIMRGQRTAWTPESVLGIIRIWSCLLNHSSISDQNETKPFCNDVGVFGGKKRLLVLHNLCTGSLIYSHDHGECFQLDNEF